jgi:hypothetical protein
MLCKKSRNILICIKMGIKCEIKYHNLSKLKIIIDKETSNLQDCDLRIKGLSATFWKKLKSYNG